MYTMYWYNMYYIYMYIYMRICSYLSIHPSYLSAQDQAQWQGPRSQWIDLVLKMSKNDSKHPIDMI